MVHAIIKIFYSHIHYFHLSQLSIRMVQLVIYIIPINMAEKYGWRDEIIINKLSR
jgi:hypothetical protein